ncbi:MAG: metallophosphoesterase [Blautia sp.]|nr:metallophosphoesterase [Lachnoclostridium sp.]MCM1211771.1 metallophosphoesterase [Blautia sp.]
MTLLFAAVIVILICFCLIMCYDCNRFVTVSYEAASGKITKECTFVLLSDLHNKSFGKQNEKLLRKIEEISPDGILIAGDMLTAQRGEKYHVAANLMEALAAKYPVYYGMGNHEHRLQTSPEEFEGLYDKYMEYIHRAGIEPLINESVSLPSANIRITGLQMEGCYYRKFRKYPMSESYLTDMLGKRQEDKFQILIAHNPDYFDEYARWGADMVVSGHVHGGLMRLPILGGVISPKLTLFPKYDGGKFECGNSVMILSRGLGTHTLPIRIWNPGELITIHLKPKT